MNVQKSLRMCRSVCVGGWGHMEPQRVVINFQNPYLREGAPDILNLLSFISSSGLRRTIDFALGPSSLQLPHPDLNSASCEVSASFWPLLGLPAFSNLCSPGRLPIAISKRIGHDVNPKKNSCPSPSFFPTQKSFPLSSLPGILMLCFLSLIDTYRRKKKKRKKRNFLKFPQKVLRVVFSVATWNKSASSSSFYQTAW